MDCFESGRTLTFLFLASNIYAYEIDIIIIIHLKAKIFHTKLDHKIFLYHKRNINGVKAYNNYGQTKRYVYVK